MSGVFGPLGLLGRVINDLCSTCAHFRIVRNKAAEKVKEIGGYESSSPGPLSSNLTGDTSLPIRHPSYSINNILGVHQTQDANENILKRMNDFFQEIHLLKRLAPDNFDIVNKCKVECQY